MPVSHFPRVTLVTPSLDQGSFIGDTLASVQAQEYPNLEYFVIDGGSRDDTADVVRRYASIITDFVAEPDIGQAHAINKGFTRASGEILCWLNADDLLEPGTLRLVAERYRSDRFSFLYGGGWKWTPARDERRRLMPCNVTSEELTYRDRLLQPATFWTREVWDRIGILDVRLHYVFDWDFFIRISRQFPMTFLAEPLATYRIHPSHKSGTGGKCRAEEIMEVVHRYASPDWRAVFDDLWLRYDDLDAPQKIVRILRAGLGAVIEPRLLLRHGPLRLALAARTLL